MEEIVSTRLLNYPSEMFIDNENIYGCYYKELKVVHFIWKKRSVGDEYRQPFLEAAKFADTHEAYFFLSDIQEQGIVGPDDRKWFEEEALPLAIDRGLKKTAIVFDGNVFKLYYINMILKRFTKSNVPMKFFKSLDDAKVWLLA